MKIRKLFLAAAAATVLGLSGAPGAFADPGHPTALGKDQAQRPDASASQEEARHAQIRRIMLPLTTGEADVQMVSKELEKIGVTNLNNLTPPSLTTMSYSNSLNLFVSSYFDSQARQQSIYSRFSWQDESYLLDANCSLGPQVPCEVGGEEVFGMSFSKDVPVETVGAYRCTDLAGSDCAKVGDPYEVNQKGVAWKVQDVVFGQDSRYNVKTGDLFLRTGDVCDFQPFASYTHTWDNAGISEVNIGWGSLGVVTTNGAKSWTKSVQGESSYC